MDNDTQFQLAISGKGLLFTKNIDYEKMRMITSLVLGEKSGGEFSETTLEENDFETRNKKQEARFSEDFLEPNEFVEEFNAQRTPDKITAFGYYLLKNDDKTRFEKDDLVALFEEARLPLPKNLNRDIRWTEKNGWIAEAPKQNGVFYITQEGIEAVEQKFPKNIRKKTVNAKT